MTIAGFGFIPNFLKQQNPALAEGGGTNHVRRGYPPILNNNSPVGNFASAAKFEPNTANRRGSSYADFGAMYSPIPNQKIGMSEGLIRMGGDITGAANQGALAAMNAGTNTYGNIMDYNRARDMEAFQLEEARRADLAERMAAAAKAKAENAPDSDALDLTNSQIAKMERALYALNTQGLTGLIQGNFNAFIDAAVGNPEAASRLLLEELRVDDALRRISQTKGAISNKEMELFLKPAPSIRIDQESTWIEWIQPRLEALRQIQMRQSQGIMLPQGTGDNEAAATGRYGGRDWSLNFSKEQADSILQFLPKNDNNDIQQYGD